MLFRSPVVGLLEEWKKGKKRIKGSEKNLGLNSWDVFHDGFSQLINVKIGFSGVITGFILLLGWIPLKQKPFIGTIINILTIGNVIDLTMYFLPTPDLFWLRHLYLYFGTVVFAMGVRYFGEVFMDLSRF